MLDNLDNNAGHDAASLNRDRAPDAWDRMAGNAGASLSSRDPPFANMSFAPHRFFFANHLQKPLSKASKQSLQALPSRL